MFLRRRRKEPAKRLIQTEYYDVVHRLRVADFRRALRLGFRHEPQLVQAVPIIRMLPITQSRIFEHDALTPEHRNQPLIRRLERQIAAEDQQPSEPDIVLDKNDESP